ncbi:synapse-associated protein 1-like [Pyxicephalus adspersus]|uniref:synapse-associated protein 1-like n=1 Tax=Pyxicephalus adspersus TaxID=30357 RepID=UPI003B5BA24E
MLRSLGSFLGLDPEPDIQTAEEKQQSPAEEKVVTELRGEDIKVCEAEETPGEEPEDVLIKQAKGFGNYLLNFASVATKKISESVAETAHTLKKSVEEGKIDGIIEKTIIGDFQKEQEKFVHEKNVKKTEAAVPPWVGYSEEETIQQQILALSAVRFFPTICAKFQNLIVGAIHQLLNSNSSILYLFCMVCFSSTSSL